MTELNNFRMRPQSAKYPTSQNNRVNLNDFKQLNKPKMNNMFEQNEYQPQQAVPQRSTSQKGPLLRPQSAYHQQNGLKKITNLAVEALKLKPPLHQLNHQDSEKLVEDIRQLKIKMNELKEENTKVKTKYMISEKEKLKYERAIQEIQLHGFTNNRLMQKLGQDANMMFNMKQSLKDMRNELDQKEEEITKMKKVIRYTKIQEIETEKKVLQDECNRLRQIISQLVEYRQYFEMGNQQQELLQNQIQEQDQAIVQLQDQNAEFARTIQELEYQNRQLQELLQEIQSSPIQKKFESQLKSLKLELNQKERELQHLKIQMEQLEKKENQILNNSSKKISRPQSSKTPQNNQNQQINMLVQEINNLRKELIDKNQENDQLRDNLGEIEQFLEANGLLQSTVSSNMPPSEQREQYNQLIEQNKKDRNIGDSQTQRQFVTQSEIYEVQRQNNMDYDQEVRNFNQPTKKNQSIKQQSGSPSPKQRPLSSSQKSQQQKKSNTLQIPSQSNTDSPKDQNINFLKASLPESQNFQQKYGIEKYESKRDSLLNKNFTENSPPSSRVSIQKSLKHQKQLDEAIDLDDPEKEREKTETIYDEVFEDELQNRQSAELKLFQEDIQEEEYQYNEDFEGVNSDQAKSQKEQDNYVVTLSYENAGTKSQNKISQSHSQRNLLIQESNHGEYLESVRYEDQPRMSNSNLRQSFSLQNEELDEDQVSDGPINY